MTFYILVVRERKKERELQAFESLQQDDVESSGDLASLAGESGDDEEKA